MIPKDEVDLVRRAVSKQLEVGREYRSFGDVTRNEPGVNRSGREILEKSLKLFLTKEIQVDVGKPAESHLSPMRTVQQWDAVLRDTYILSTEATRTNEFSSSLGTPR